MSLPRLPWLPPTSSPSQGPPAPPWRMPSREQSKFLIAEGQRLAEEAAMERLRQRAAAYHVRNPSPEKT